MKKPVAASEPEREPESDLLGTLISKLGKEEAFKIVETYGGTRVYVPNEFKSTSAIAKEIGAERATMLIPLFGGNVITVPIARAWKVIVYRERGMSMKKIALKLGCCEDTIVRILKDTGLGGSIVPRFETVQIDRTYWSGLSAILHSSIPRGIPAPWPLSIQASTLMDMVIHIDRDLLGVPAPPSVPAEDATAASAPANET